MRRARLLSTQLLVGQLVVALIMAVVGFLLTALIVQGVLDRQYEQRALAVAHAVATLPAVRHDLTIGDPRQEIQTLASQILDNTGVTYIVVADSQGIRFSHPNPALIGKRVSTPPTPVATGGDWVGIQTGTLGR